MKPQDNTYRLRVTSLRFCDGTHFEPGKLTVFIGPNNAGKTRALADISNEITGSNIPKVVVTETGYTRPETFDALRSSDYSVFFEPTEHGSRSQDLAIDLCSHNTVETHLRWPEGFYLLWSEAHINNDKLREVGLADKQISDWFGYLFGSRLVALLRTSQRLHLLEKGNLATDHRTPQSLLEMLLRADRSVEERIHNAFRETFDTDFVLDYSLLNRLRVMIGVGPEDLPDHPRELGKALSEHIQLQEQGDGMRSYLGLLVALEATDRPIILIDEPETFLHPPQARRMGELLAESSRDYRQVFVATHSVDVLRGILSATTDVQIVRLSRPAGVTKVCILNTERLSAIAADPILSSARVLDGLFYSTAVVVEGERDSRFYQAVTDRLRPATMPYFLIAGGKQTIPKLIAEYNRHGIPVAAIVDFDVLRDQTSFSELVSAGSATSEEVAKLKEYCIKINDAVSAMVVADHRLAELIKELESLKELLDNSKDAGTTLAAARTKLKRLQATADTWREAKQKGRSAFDNGARQIIENLLTDAMKAGVFICPDGELESFFPDELNRSDKAKWLSGALGLVAKFEIRRAHQPWNFVVSVLAYLDARIQSASVNE